MTLAVDLGQGDHRLPDRAGRGHVRGAGSREWGGAERGGAKN